MMLDVLTVATRETPGYFRLLRSAEKFGWPLRTYWLQERSLKKIYPGQPEEELQEMEDAYRSFMERKHIYLQSALGEGRFLFLDAWDTAFIRPFEEFSLTGWGDLVFSGQKQAWPEVGYQPFFAAKGGVAPCLNSGVVWGSARTYKELCPPYLGPDQLLWTRVWKDRDGMSVGIDRNMEVAATLEPPEDDQSAWKYQQGRWIYAPTGTKPFVVHAAGKRPFPACLEP